MFSYYLVGLEDLLQEARLREQLNVQNVNNLQNVLNQNGVEQQNQNRATAATNSTANNLGNLILYISIIPMRYNCSQSSSHTIVGG